jgi:hypothetical protein
MTYAAACSVDCDGRSWPAFPLDAPLRTVIAVGTRSGVAEGAFTVFVVSFPPINFGSGT